MERAVLTIALRTFGQGIPLKEHPFTGEVIVASFNSHPEISTDDPVIGSTRKMIRYSFGIPDIFRSIR
jgi:hypothetical protein